MGAILGDKKHRLRALVQKRRESRYDGHGQIGDYHHGVYECDWVSPYSKSAGNLEADLMILLQDWASDEVLSGPILQARVELGHDPDRITNRRLKKLLLEHLELSLQQVYATNLFPFVKRGSQNAKISRRDLIRAANEFALPQIEIVQPRFVVCLGKAVADAIAVGLNRPRFKTLADAIESPYEDGGTQYWCQAHPSPQGTNARNRGDPHRVWADWQALREKMTDGSMMRTSVEPSSPSTGE